MWVENSTFSVICTSDVNYSASRIAQLEKFGLIGIFVTFTLIELVPLLVLHLSNTLSPIPSNIFEAFMSYLLVNI